MSARGLTHLELIEDGFTDLGEGVYVKEVPGGLNAYCMPGATLERAEQLVDAFNHRRRILADQLLDRSFRELAAAATEVVNAGFACAPDLWKRLHDATAAIAAELGGPMSSHEQLLERGAESLGDGVYAEAGAEGLKLTGNAFGRENVIYLEGGTYGALRRFAQEHGYEEKPR